jgi:hypothetical protein
MFERSKKIIKFSGNTVFRRYKTKKLFKCLKLGIELI